MKTVIATGCPNSGWERVVPLLVDAGLHPAGEAFELWHDRVFDLVRREETSLNNQDALPDKQLAEDVASILQAGEGVTSLGAESRSLWLLDFWAETFPDARFLLFFTSAETSLAFALEQGVDPQQSLNDWREGNRRLIKFQRHNRGRSLLLNAESACQNPHQLFEVCQRINISLEDGEFERRPTDVPSMLERLIARHLLLEEQPIADLQIELEASSPPLGTSCSQLDLDSDALLTEYYQRRGEEEALRGDLYQTEQRLAESVKELQSAKEEQVALRDKADDLEKKYTETRQQTEHLRQANSQLEVAKKETAKESDLMLLQLHQVQEELEHYFSKYQQLVSSNELSTPVVRDEAGVGSRDHESFTKESLVSDNPPRRLSIKEKRRLRQEIKILRKSSFFDEDWYLMQYPDVAQAGMDPVKHFLRFGAEEGRNPSVSFDVIFYRESNPDVASTEINPLIHFLKFGRDEGREPTR